MATLSSHLLNALDGTHAGGIKAQIIDVENQTDIASGQTDDGGRLQIEIVPAKLRPRMLCELRLDTADYWQHADCYDQTVIPEIALRFIIHDVSARYHMPVILSPHSFSTWKSG